MQKPLRKNHIFSIYKLIRDPPENPDPFKHETMRPYTPKLARSQKQPRQAPPDPNITRESYQPLKKESFGAHTRTIQARHVVRSPLGETSLGDTKESLGFRVFAATCSELLYIDPDKLKTQRSPYPCL